MLFIIVLLICAVIVLPDQQYRQIAQKLVEKATDRNVEIGELITTRGLTTTLEIRDFSLANAAWADNGQMINAQRLHISLDLIPLLQGKAQINDFSADDLFVDLHKNEKGEANWQFKQKQPEPGKKFNQQIFSRIMLNSLNLADSQLSYIDAQRKLKYGLRLEHLRLKNHTQNPDLQQLDAQGSFNDLPFAIDGEAGLTGAMVETRTLPFNLAAKLNETDLSISGQLAAQSDGLYLTTDVDAHTPSLTDLSAFTVQELPPVGPISISAAVEGNLKTIPEKGMRVDDLQIIVDDPNIKLDVNGKLSGLGATNSGDISINLDVSELSEISQLVGLQKQLPGTLSLDATASGSGESFSLKISDALLDSPFLNARISGQVGDLLKSREANISITASAPDLEIVTQLFARKMPPQWGPVEATAVLTGKDGVYALSDIVAQLTGTSTLSAMGSIDNLVKFDGMELDFEATLASLNEISAFTPNPLPDLGPITADGKLYWREGRLMLNDAKAHYSGEYGQADVAGSIGNLIKFDDVNLTADAKLPDLDVAELFSGIEMPALKQFTASADLVSPTARDLSAKNLQASYDVDGIKVNASGSVDSIIKKRAVLNLDLNGEIDSLASVNPLLKTSLPGIGPITAKARLSGAVKDIELNNLDILISDSDIYGTLKGNLGRLAGFRGINLDVDLSTPAVDQLARRLNFQSNIKKPANLVSHVKYEDGTINFDKSELDLAGDKIIGRLSLENYLDKESRPRITGNINVLNFNVKQLSGENRDQPSQEQKQKLLSEKPLPYDFIETTDLDLEINIGRLRGNIFDFADSTVLVKSTDGLFKLGPFKGRMSDGDAAFQLDIDTRKTPTITKVNFNIEGFNMAKAGVFRDSKQIESRGDALLNFNIEASGRTPASIMATANGGGAIYVEDLLLRKGALDLITSNLIKKTIDAVNPFRKKEKDTKISCAALAFKIDDGLLITPFGLAAEASDYSVTGNAEVDFKTEAIDLEFKTKVKKMLAINPFEKLTGLVKVVGELTNPEVTLNPKGILDIGATVGAAIATGGLSYWAQDQLEKLNAKTELCSKALGKPG